MSPPGGRGKAVQCASYPSWRHGVSVPRVRSCGPHHFACRWPARTWDPSPSQTQAILEKLDFVATTGVLWSHGRIPEGPIRSCRAAVAALPDAALAILLLAVFAKTPTDHWGAATNDGRQTIAQRDRR